MRIFLVILLFVLSNFSFAADICLEAKNCSYEFSIDKSFLRYYSSYKIDSIPKNIKKAVIVVHGALRDGDNYFNNMMRVASAASELNNTLILAPHFKRSDDQKASNELYWGRRWYQKWKYGYLSQDEDEISSFEVMDLFIEKLKALGINEVVITGHSAGGQFTQRYAVGTTIDQNLKVSFVPANPSSYMYLHPKRYIFRDGNYEEVSINSCPEYNYYIYGLVDRARYLDRLRTEELRKNYLNKNIVYLMGEQDHDTDMLDQSCEANLQGVDRFERSRYFHYYFQKYFEGGEHRFVSVPNVGHDNFEMYNSKEGREVLFGISDTLSKNILYNKIGNSTDVITQAKSLTLLLGGGKNEINGFKEFLKASAGGDIVVLTGKDYLNQRYTHDLWNMAKELNISIDSVETIALLNADAANEEFVINKVENAEAIFFTGGNQYHYISRISNSKLKEVISKKIQTGVALGGTSAGLAIMGEYIFSAKFGGLRSSTALKDPNSKYLALTSNFLDIPELQNVITDTHFTQRSREGRLLSFMYRAQRDYSQDSIFGLGVDEQTSLVIDHNRVIRIYGHGDVYLYKSENTQLTSSNNGLNYSGIRRLKLKQGVEYLEFSLIDFSNSVLINVKDGRINKGL